MRERPILFSSPMVRAILAGTKTQTRRVASKPVRHPDLGNLYTAGALLMEHEPRHVIERACPYGHPGDRLWVRETFKRDIDHMDSRKLIVYRADDAVHDAGDAGAFDFPDVGWKPSIHMPRAASRITLEITGVRVERLQAIIETDAKAEGIEGVHIGEGWRRYADAGSELAGLPPCTTARESFQSLWESIRGPSSWDANPWVWVLDFKRVTP